MAEVAAIRIESEDEAWAYLERALAGDLPENLVPTVAFTGWPHLEVYLPDTPVQASMSPSMMKAFIELQNAVYRSHAAFSAGKPTARALSSTEKERLEFRVKVAGGSSKYDVDFTKIFETLGTASIGKMTGPEIVAAIIAVALAIGSTTVLLAWLKHRADIRKSELEARGKDRLFDAFETMVKQDTERQATWLAAQARIPALADVRAVTEDAKAELLRAIADENGGRVNGVDIDGDVANDLISSVRRRSEEAKMTGVFRVDKVDTTVPDGFRVTLHNTQTGDDITASLQDALISEEHRARIRTAEWSKKLIVVDLVGRKGRTRFVDAVVMDVRDLPPPRERGRA